MIAEVTKIGLFDCQICIPKSWTDEEAKSFAEVNNPCGTANGWQIRREGDEALGGDPERQPCAQREAYVHIVLDA